MQKLSIGKHLIEMHGGRIWVDSVVGVGSTFAFSLPLPGSDLAMVDCAAQDCQTVDEHLT